jgi:hypothetical protein
MDLALNTVTESINNSLLTHADMWQQMQRAANLIFGLQSQWV